MGWARTLFLGDIGNRLDITDCEEDIHVLKASLMEMHTDSQSQDEELLKLRRETDQLKLCLAAIIRLLAARNVLTVEQLQKMVNIIDSEDGAMDGKTRNNIV